MLKSRFLIIAALLWASLAAVAQSNSLSHTRLEPETLRYRVMFKWGLINKKAGSAVMTLSRDKRHYTAQLAAHSEPWADRIYRVRDTLNGRMSVDGMTPLFYEKIAYEGNEFKHDVVRYDYSTTGIAGADCTRKVVKKNELRVDEQRRLESDSKAVDMLTSFYYMRTLPFESWQPGHTVKVDIFSGKQKEVLSIVYLGTEDVDVDGNAMPSYHISFRFTSKGGTKTSDDMDAWISTKSDRRPLRLEGKLPVGKVHCIIEP